MNHVIAIILAVIIDAIIGDPRTWPHPVKWIGKFIYLLDKALNKGNSRKLKGTIMLFLVVTLTFTISLSIILLAYHVHIIVGILIEALLIATTIAQKGLKDASLTVYEPLETEDFDKARSQLSEIVGRDTDRLLEPEIVRATVETVAENTSDGVTAPLFWAFIGGAPLALAYRAINTCDSMVGYQNESYINFGWASAKFDDMVNYLPARITAFIMLLVNKRPKMSFLQTWSLIQQDARHHASPNSGWLEATVAYILQIQLGGVNYYKGEKSNAALMGTLQASIHPLDKLHIIETIRLMNRTTTACLALIVIGGIVIELALTWI